jgi:hypothetical protein
MPRFVDGRCGELTAENAESAERFAKGLAVTERRAVVGAGRRGSAADGKSAGGVARFLIPERQ